MQPALTSLIAASIAFVVTHFLLSHPLRSGLVARLGEQGFLGVYSLVSLACFGWMVVAFRAAGAPGVGPLWQGSGTAMWAIASLLTLVAMVLLLGSFRGNPALPQVSTEAVADARADGVYAITRHPMMWGVALWALAHALVSPTPRVLVLMTALAVLALLGAHLQDRKKAALLGEAWAGWEAKTSYWPRFGALTRVSPVLWLVAVLVWLAVTRAHLPAMQVPAGVWRWVG
jgi:uncharacterized membrane protein